jgi:hypothetical protein
MIVTQDTIATAIAASGPDVTLMLEGVFPSIPLKDRKPNLTLDCTKATITGDTRTGKLDGLTIRNGLFTSVAPLAFVEGGRGLRIEGSRFDGPSARSGTAINIQGMSEVTIKDVRLDTYANGLVLARSSYITVEDIAFRNMRKDMIQAAAVWVATVRRMVGHGTRPGAGDHSDGVQIRSIAGLKPTCDVTLEDITITGDVQAVVTTSKAGDGGFDRVALRRARLCAGQPSGAGFLDVRGLTLEDVEVSTVPGSLYLSKVFVAPTCTDVTMSNVRYAPYRAKRGAVLAA